tara:strand:- start:170710 stop:171996 length:1287 start_codon:yes stop_codon:yes gene_type:complete
MEIRQPEKRYDVVIAGGGLVGGSFALMLAGLCAGAGLRILLADAAPVAASVQSATVPGSPGDFDARSTALSWGSRQIYQQAGLWSELEKYGCAIRDIHVSDRGHFGAVRLHSRELQVEALGYVLENRHLSAVINNALLNHPGIDVCAPSIVKKVTPQPAGVQVSLHLSDDSEQIISAGLLVLADGGRSGLCEHLGISLDKTPYGQQALICNIAFEKDHQGLAFERFTDTGPMAVLPLTDELTDQQSHGAECRHRGALVWTLAQDNAQEIFELPEPAFLAALQQRFGSRLGQITRAGARSLYPLALTLAREQIRPGVVLLGNVAHTLHPVAGQGLNLALRDADALAQLLATAVRDGNQAGLGEYALLEKFLRSQQADQNRTVMFSDLTTRLFSNARPALAAGRNLGLLTMDLLPPARKWFARQAMGLRG